MDFWIDVQEAFNLTLGPCIMTQLVFFVGFGILMAVFMWLRWLWQPPKGGD